MGATAAQPCPLTADICARAIIAAAQTYGDDPQKAVLAKSGRFRRSLAPAAVGLAEAMSLSLDAASRTLGVSTGNVFTAKRNGSETFRAASRAARYAGWRPEARVSVAEPALALKTPLPGPLIAHTRPPQPPPLPLPMAERPLRDRVLGALAGGSLNSMSIASCVDAKEMTVSSTLSQLEREGLIESRAVENGPRRLEWLLKVAQAA